MSLAMLQEDVCVCEREREKKERGRVGCSSPIHSFSPEFVIRVQFNHLVNFIYFFKMCSSQIVTKNELWTAIVIS